MTNKLFEKLYKMYEGDGHVFVSRKDKPYRDGNSESDVVVIVPWTHDSKLICVKQFRKTINDYIWELPAGKIDKGETAVACAERELKEETGLSIEKIIYKRPFCFPSVGITDESSTLIGCRVFGELTNKHNQDDEIIEPFALGIDDAIDIFSSNQLVDSKLAIIIGGIIWALD